MKYFFVVLMLALSSPGCKFFNLADKANNTFADQHFKTAIGLIETYKLRYGYYPARLDSLTFMGEWDKMIFNSVNYERLDTGYSLDVQGIVQGTPTNLSYPKEFWQGLGIKKSNILKTHP